MEHQPKDPHLESFEVSTETHTRDGKVVRYYHHSQSPAIWTGVTIATLGFLVGAIAMVWDFNWTLFIIGGGLIVLSVIVTYAMKAMGLGHG